MVLVVAVEYALQPSADLRYRLVQIKQELRRKMYSYVLSNITRGTQKNIFAAI
jgi:hypothetical protein